jgi:hypothetical protein
VNERQARVTRTERWIGGVVIPLTLVGLTIADFTDDGKISHELLGALLLFGSGVGGRILDIGAASRREKASDDPR